MGGGVAILARLGARSVGAAVLTFCEPLAAFFFAAKDDFAIVEDVEEI